MATARRTGPNRTQPHASPKPLVVDEEAPLEQQCRERDADVPGQVVVAGAGVAAVASRSKRTDVVGAILDRASTASATSEATRRYQP
ncbi:MAG: hypothetical protein M0Z66_05020 [Thermaerobacter sp.]|nr:hypothetical protein [Thermaerobacter sp.]